MRVTISDMRKFYCVKGIKSWFEHQGLDFKDFLANGIDAQDLLDTNDSSAYKIVESMKDNG